VGAAQLPEALSGPSPHARLTVHPHLNAGDVGVRPKPVDSRLDTLRIEHQILSRHRLACGAFRVIAPLVPAFHPPLRHLMKANASNLWRCHRHHGSQQHHRHLRRGLRHSLGLLDGVLQDKFSGFMVPAASRAAASASASSSSFRLAVSASISLRLRSSSSSLCRSSRLLAAADLPPGAGPPLSVHRGSKAVKRLQTRYPRLLLVHAPIHASWLNQVEIYFSIVQRKVLNPNDFANLESLAERLLDFQYYWEATARPFEWKFTRQDLTQLMNKLGRPTRRAA